MKRVYVLCLLTVSISGLVASEMEGFVGKGDKNRRVLHVVPKDGFSDEHPFKSLGRQAHYHRTRKGSWNKEVQGRKLAGRIVEPRSSASGSRHAPPPPKTLQEFRVVSSAAKVRPSHAQVVAGEFSSGRARRGQGVAIPEPRNLVPQRPAANALVVQDPGKKTEKPASFSKPVGHGSSFSQPWSPVFFDKDGNKRPIVHRDEPPMWQKTMSLR